MHTVASIGFHPHNNAKLYGAMGCSIMCRRTMQVEINNELERAVLDMALRDKREFEEKHNQKAAVNAIDNILDQL